MLETNVATKEKCLYILIQYIYMHQIYVYVCIHKYIYIYISFTIHYIHLAVAKLFCIAFRILSGTFPPPATFYGNRPHNLIQDPFYLLRPHHISSSVPKKVVKKRFVFWMRFLTSMNLSSITNTADIYQTYSKHWIHPVFSPMKSFNGKVINNKPPPSWNPSACWQHGTDCVPPWTQRKVAVPTNIRKSRREMSSLLPFLEFSEMKSSCPFWVFPKIVGFPPKSSTLIGFSIINHPFWGTPIFGKHPYHLWTTITKHLEIIGGR